MKMKCKTCSAEFEGDFCPACATPAQKSKSKICFYKDPWFWISFVLFICLIINIPKGWVSTKDKTLSSSVTKNAVSNFFEESFGSDKSNTSNISSSSGQSITSSSSAGANLESSSQMVLTNSTTVYITPNGKRYHISEKCAGKNAIATNLEKAKDEEKTPCQRCLK